MMKDYPFRIAALLLLLTITYSPFSQASIAVVVHPDNSVDLDEAAVRKLFLSKSKSFPNGSKVDTYDLPAGDAIRNEFSDKILRKSEARLNAYWARMLFSSKAKPPMVLKTVEDVKTMIANNPNGIAYIDSSDVDGSVRVLMTKP